MPGTDMFFATDVTALPAPWLLWGTVIALILVVAFLIIYVPVKESFKGLRVAHPGKYGTSAHHVRFLARPTDAHISKWTDGVPNDYHPNPLITREHFTGRPEGPVFNGPDTSARNHLYFSEQAHQMETTQGLSADQWAALQQSYTDKYGQPYAMGSYVAPDGSTRDYDASHYPATRAAAKSQDARRNMSDSSLAAQLHG